MGKRLTVVTHMTGECVILVLAGELDVTNATEVDEAVSAACEEPVSSLVFDMAELTFMDSAGVRTFVRLRRRAAERRQAVALAGLTPPVARILEITGLSRAFDIHATIDEALPAAR